MPPTIRLILFGVVVAIIQFWAFRRWGERSDYALVAGIVIVGLCIIWARRHSQK